MPKVRFIKDHPSVKKFKKGALCIIDGKAAKKMKSDGLIEILSDQNMGLRGHHRLIQRKESNQVPGSGGYNKKSIEESKFIPPGSDKK